MMKSIKQILLISAFAFMISCSDDKIADFDTLRSQYSGVNEYDSLGRKIYEVDNDWQPECYKIPSFGGNHFCFYATYPLPATDTLTLWLASAIEGNYKVWLALNDSTVALALLDEVKPMGDFKLKIPYDNQKLHKNLVYRLFVESTDFKTNQTQKRFGDVIWK
jgi:hypothetical protein